MASARFESMQDELERLAGEYISLLHEFQQTGDPDIFVDLDEKLLRLQNRAYGLANVEEQLEIQNGVTVLRNGVNSIFYSSVY